MNRSTYGDRGRTAIAFQMNEDFGRVLQKQMEYYNSNTNADNIGRVQQQLNDVKGVMVENIEKVLERGEKIELLVDKTERLQNQAMKFERQSKRLKDEMRWRNIRCKLIIGACVIVGLWLILSLICDFDFKKCGAK